MYVYSVLVVKNLGPDLSQGGELLVIKLDIEHEDILVINCPKDLGDPVGIIIFF